MTAVAYLGHFVRGMRRRQVCTKTPSHPESIIAHYSELIPRLFVILSFLFQHSLKSHAKSLYETVGVDK